jgi:hypothetical protein
LDGIEIVDEIVIGFPRRSRSLLRRLNEYLLRPEIMVFASCSNKLKVIAFLNNLTLHDDQDPISPHDR